VRPAIGPGERNDTAQSLSVDMRLVFEGVRGQDQRETARVIGRCGRRVREAER